MESSGLSCKLIFNMKKLFENKYFTIIARVVLGSLFMYASFDKMAHPEAFANVIDNYRIVPFQFVNALAIFLPWLELITGLLLVTGKWIRASLIIYSALLVVFIIALSQALIRGLDISCGCFSLEPSTTTEIWLRIIGDIIMLFVCVLMLKYSKFEENTETGNINFINQTN